MIYILRMKGTNFYKVGFTKQSVKDRVKSIQVGCPRELTAVLIFRGGRSRERAIHQHLAPYVTDGGKEWFDLPSNYPIKTLRTIRPIIRHIPNGKRPFQDPDNIQLPEFPFEPTFELPFEYP